MGMLTLVNYIETRKKCQVHSGSVFLQIDIYKTFRFPEVFEDFIVADKGL